MKTLLAYLLLFAMGVTACWAFMSATADVSAQRELAGMSICDRQLADCKTGHACNIKGVDFLTITARGRE